MRQAAKRIAGAMRAAAVRHAEQAGPRTYEATLTRWEGQDDFIAELHGQDLEVDDDDVVLGQTVRQYDATTGIEEGDALVLVEVGDHDYRAIDVVSDNE